MLWYHHVSAELKGNKSKTDPPHPPHAVLVFISRQSFTLKTSQLYHCIRLKKENTSKLPDATDKCTSPEAIIEVSLLCSAVSDSDFSADYSITKSPYFPASNRSQFTSKTLSLFKET